ncbi:hypothetical protein DFH07DRAFT_782395 [Mycena maculata]|uniref:Uncharacterized protein n=1 Tax=Mycena maculata TaxID=230809 RepID=A0AAD7HT87_9AGAR|nr:hypothetical protein DFH07DRAFT_782395 [Mycena maculata]
MASYGSCFLALWTIVLGHFCRAVLLNFLAFSWNWIATFYYAILFGFTAASVHVMKVVIVRDLGPRVSSFENSDDYVRSAPSWDSDDTSDPEISEDPDDPECTPDILRPICVTHGPVLRLRGGYSSDPDSDEESETPSPSNKRKRKLSSPKPCKSRNKGKGKAHADSDSEIAGIRVTVGKGKQQGMYVDEVCHIDYTPESWAVPPSDHRIAYVIDLSDSPDCLGSGSKRSTVDPFIKKQCQDSLTGPTGSHNPDKLAEVLILDESYYVDCRRSNLTCGGAFVCSLAAEDHLDDCERWDDDLEDLISAPICAAKSAEAGGSLIALATQFVLPSYQSVPSLTPLRFYQSVTFKSCKGMTEGGQFECGSHAVMRKFTDGMSNGKSHFIGCSNWEKQDGISHRFTKIPASVRVSILIQLFRGEAVEIEDDDVVTGPCPQIVHPSHLPNNKICSRTHFRDGKHVRGHLLRRPCPAKILILIPIDEGDLRAVVIPKAGTPHNHPTFPRAKLPFAAESEYNKCIASAGPIGATTLRVDKSSSTRSILGGRLPQEIHAALINNRKRRDLLRAARLVRFPAGTGMEAVWNEFESDRSRKIGDRYIHAVNTLSDETHVIITVNPELAALTLDASWIMVDTTFAVVHGKTNEWKLIIWLHGLDKRTVIGRVWSNRATRESFVLVWNGIFETIQAVTGKALNFKIFSKTSCLLGAISDSEGAQAQALGDVIILRRMNTQEVEGSATVEVNIILMFIWKTCIVHFNRGVFALEAYTDSNTFQYLLSFPYLETTTEILEYYAFCNASTTPKVKSSHAQDNQAARQSRSRAKAEQEKIDGGAKQLKAKLKASEQSTRDKDLEIQCLRSQLTSGDRFAFSQQSVVGPSTYSQRPITGPSTPQQSISRPSTPRRRVPRLRNDKHSPEDLPTSSPAVTPRQLPQLNVFTGLPLDAVPDPRSDFDYAMALQSEFMDAVIEDLQRSSPVHFYPVNGDNEILASDPHPCSSP